MKNSALRLSVPLVLQVLFLSLQTDAIPGTNTTEGHSSSSADSGGVCEDGWTLYEPTQTCFQGKASRLVQQSALDYCTTSGGRLPSAERGQLEFIAAQATAAEATSLASIWLGLEMRRLGDSNSSSWHLVDLSGRGRDLDWTGLATPEPTDWEAETKVCVVLNVQAGKTVAGQLELRSCKEKSGFFCAQDAKLVCIDRKGNQIMENERYVPPGHDACYFCRCMEGRPGMCLTTMCAQPHCELYRPDPEQCCQYICTDGGNGGDTPNLIVSDNMRWVLTMLTSFLLLGMMLFMVYRMRQKRIAYLRYRAQQMHEGNMMDFEPGTGPPPPPNLDDIEGAVYREPPPPYSFLKEEHHIPTDQPPPYISTVALPMDINRNRDRRSVFQQDSDAVALLDGSVSSEPNTPTLITAGVPAILPSPPAFVSSTEHSNLSTPQTENSTPGGEGAITPTAGPDATLPSINTTV